MTKAGIIALIVAAFIVGAFVGVIFIALCISNEKYDDGQECYDLGVKNGILKGRAEMRDEMMDLCSHCTYYGRTDND